MERQLKFAVDVITLLEAWGFECLAVGGFVRDLLSDRVPHDIDLATNAKPEDIHKAVDGRLRVIDMGGERFGTTVLYTYEDEESLEITTYRKDIKCDGRKAVVEFADTIEEDLNRRDFTINAMAMNLFTGEVIDLHGGKNDLAMARIKAVGNPEERFKEDYLRMLRACRFTALDRDMSVEYHTAVAIKRNVKGILRISPERVRMEFLKAMEYKVPSNMIRAMLDTGLLKLLLPALHETVGVEQNRHHSVYMCRECGELHTVRQGELVPWEGKFHQLDRHTEFRVLLEKNLVQYKDAWETLAKS